MTGFALTIVTAALAMSNANASSPDIPDALQGKIDAARTACAEFDNGEFAMESDAVVRVDIDGDGEADWVIDEARFACSTAASLYGGTGGSMSHFLVANKVTSMQNKGWEAVKFGPHVAILARVHGSQCDGINPTPCVTASVWDGEAATWRSTSASWE